MVATDLPKRISLLAISLIFGICAMVAPATPSKTYSSAELSKIASKLISENANNWNLDPTQLKVHRTFETNDGLVTIQFRQFIHEVPVLNSFASVTVRDDGTFVSQLSQVSQVSQLPKSVTNLGLARILTSQLATSAWHRKSVDSEMGVPQLLLADPTLTDLETSKPSLIWRIPIYARSNPLAAKQLFVSNDSGRILKVQSLAKTLNKSPMPYVCDLQKSKPSFKFRDFVDSKRIGNLSRNYIGRTSEYPLCELSDPGRIKSSTAPAVNSMNETVEYFQTYIGVDISQEKYLGNIAPFANFGKRLNAKTFCDKNPKSQYCVPTISGHTNVCAYDSYYRDVECPLENAFWVPWSSSECHSGACSGMFFGRGFDKADDVVAHELAHGVSTADAFLEGLCDTCDAEAISEALSDFFGQAVDQFNQRPGEKADVSWGMGEDITGGPFRNMAMTGITRPCSNNLSWSPIKQIDDLWDNRCDSHTNLGPADRFAWLISNGGTQNGVTVAPIGNAPWGTKGNYLLCNKTRSNCTATSNMTRLAFRSLPYLSGNSTYADFATAMTQACNDLTFAKKKPFSAKYCNRVSAALAATGITPLEISDVTKVSVYSGISQTISATFGTAQLSSVDVAMKLQFKPSGTSTWQTLATGQTDSLGQVTFQVIFPGTGTYRVSTVPSELVGTYTSSFISIN